ncbi:MAG: type II secretion system protein GspJ [Pelagimonas sp.]|uniref:type II secretion system protein GspJ n=1 Tax=Pelagimonas sp. TaxID=2073170 RepID=UPI003D6AB39E
MRPWRSDTGLSLIELVVALSIFALVAVMGAQALTGMLRTQDRQTERSDQNAHLTRAVSLLRADLSSAIPMAFYPPDRQAPQSAVRFRSGVFSLSVAGRRGVVAEQTVGAGFQRVDWILRDETLSRQSWGTLIPAQNSARQKPQQVLTGVRNLTVQSYLQSVGWIDGANFGPAFTTSQSDGDSAGSAPEVYSSALPKAIKLSFELQGFGPIVLVETY